MKLYQHISVNTIYGRAVILQQILRQGGVREPEESVQWARTSSAAIGESGGQIFTRHVDGTWLRCGNCDGQVRIVQNQNAATHLQSLGDQMEDLIISNKRWLRYSHEQNYKGHCVIQRVGRQEILQQAGWKGPVI